MWTGWASLALASCCGLYAMQQHHDDGLLAQAGNAATLAASMALYRDAVVHYAHQHPGFVGKVREADLSLPDWYVAPEPGLWSNHVRGDGLIAVYATRLPRVDIGAEVAALAQGSELAGRADRARDTIAPSAHAGAGIALPAIPGAAVPDGAPVWLAHRY